MSAPELRAAIRVFLDQLDDGVKDSIRRLPPGFVCTSSYV